MKALLDFDPSLTWEVPPPDVALPAVAAMTGVSREVIAAQTDFLVRVTTLPFFKNLRLWWLRRRVSPGSGNTLDAFVLRDEQTFFALDGTRASLQDALEHEHAPVGVDVQEAFLRFHLFVVRGDNGAFQLLESAEPLALKGDEAADTLPQRVIPLTKFPATQPDSTRYALTLMYEASLFAAVIRVEPEGIVEMESDSPLPSALQPADFMPWMSFTAPADLVDRNPPGGPHGTGAPSASGSGDTRANRLVIARGAAGKSNNKSMTAASAETVVPPREKIADRDVLRRFMSVLLEAALAQAGGMNLPGKFNATDGAGIAQFSRFLLTTWPVVIVQTGVPFAEELIAEILTGPPFEPNKANIDRARAVDGDDTKLRMPATLADGTLLLIPMHSYRSIVDVERAAYDIGLRDVATLVACERLGDVPEPLRRIADLVLTLPRMDEQLFARLFAHVLDLPLPAQWRRGGASWVRYLVATDFQQPRKLGLDARESLRFLRDRVQDRLRRVDPRESPGIAQLHGLGEARTIAEDLIHDIHAARAGRIGWDAVDRGMLLVGPPGTGKTTLARAIARDCDVKFIAASATGWQAAGHLGDHIRAMRTDFAEARRYAPAILFIDEIDSVGNRQQFAGPNAQYSTEVVNALIELIQGLDPLEPVIVIAATNHPERVDPALRRAGRLDRLAMISYPNVEALDAIYGHFLAPLRTQGRVGADVDTRALGGMAFGLTGADVEGHVRGAVRRARKRDGLIAQEDLVAEITNKPRTEQGAVRLTQDEMRRVAVHEAGHALARCLNPNGTSEISWISIVPRADGALGFVATVPSGLSVMTRARYVELLEVFLAGRAAEEIEYGADGVSGGAGGSSPSSDLAAATRVATSLVCHYGLGGEGSLIWREAPEAEQKVQIDALLRKAYASVSARLRAHRSELTHIVELLLEHQEVSGEALRKSLDSQRRLGRSFPSEPVGTRAVDRQPLVQ